MVKPSADVKEMLANQQVISLATADKNGVPNICPIGFMKVRDDETPYRGKFFLETDRSKPQSCPQSLRASDESLQDKRKCGTDQ